LLANIDESKVAAAGIRRVAGRRLVLYTDLAARPEIDELAAVFDQAFGAWCGFFGVDPAQQSDWRALACLMGDKARFEAAGLLPSALPDFRNGYSVGRCLWLHDQTSPYYRRHLLLHEGTHAFMDTVAHCPGPPPWYAEGLAELLATHRWQDGRLALGVFPQSADEVPRLGRIEMIQKAFAAGKALDLAQVLAFGPRAHLEVEPYAWCWAAAALLERHPRTRDRFRALGKAGSAEQVPRDLTGLAPGAERELAEAWQVFVADLDYGYDFERNQLDLQPAAAATAELRTATIQSDRGWQNTGLRLEAGKPYRFVARGRYQVATEADPASPGGPRQVWWCEPGGVTLRYYRERPLGELLAAVRPNDLDPERELTPLARPQPVGLGRELVPARSGTLFLKINDAPGELADNAGTLEVEIAQAP
jgi:hypothetical protein